MLDLRPYQASAIEAINEADRQGVKRPLVVHPTGTGKGHPLNTPVPTPQGWRKWGDLVPGDLVFGSDGSPTRITAVYDRGVLPTWRVTFSDRSTIEVDPEHLWAVQDYRYRRTAREHRVLSISEIATRGLTFGSSRRWAVPLAAVKYGDADLPIGPYTLGALIANGALSGVGTVLTTPDRYVVDLIRAEGHQVNQVQDRTPGICPRYSLPGLTPVIRELGLNVRSSEKFIPSQYLVGSINQRTALLQGLMDGDGSAREGRRTANYCTTSPRLAEDVRELVTSLGGTATINSLARDRNGTSYQDITVVISVPSSMDLFGTPRKQGKTGPRRTFEPRRTIVGIERVEDQEIRCITVDAPDSLYVVGRDHIVTHNTVTFSHLIAQRAGIGRALVLVHRDELANQTVEKIGLVAPELTTGIVKAERDEVDRDVVVASVQTIHRDNRLEALLAAGPVETVVVDEAHHAPAPTWTKVLTGLGSYSSYGPLTVGFTATPERDGKSLGVWEKVVSYMSIREAIYAGYLCGVTGQTVQTSMDLGNVRKTRGDYADGSLGTELESSGAIEEIADAYLTYAKDRKGVAFTPTVETATHLAAALCERGISAEMVSGQTPTDKRRAILGRLKSGATQVVTNCAVLCLDDQTEILTDQGWVGIDKMTYTHRVANWDDGRVHFVEPQEIVVRDRQPGEDMYVLETKRRSIRVTGRHRMLYRERRGDKWSKAPVDDLVGRALELPVSGRAEPSFIDPGSEPSLGRRDRAVSANAYNLRKREGYGWDESFVEAARRVDRKMGLRRTPPHKLTLDECRLIGFWLGDGSKNELIRSGVEYTLSQSNSYPRIIEWVDELLVRLNLHHVRREKIGKTPYVQWSLPRGTGGGSQERNGVYGLEPYLDKKGSTWLWGLDENQFTALLEGLWYADGNHGQAENGLPESFRITATKQRKPLGLLQAIAVVRGWSATITKATEPPSPNHNQQYTLHFHRRSTHQMGWNRTDLQIQREQEDWKPERVWCVKTDTRNIITRRRGTVTVMGNTEGFDEPSVSCVVVARPTKFHGLYVQMVGRGTRIYPGKSDLLVLDVTGASERHDLVAVVDLGLDTDDPAGPPKEPGEGRVCAACSGPCVDPSHLCRLCSRPLPLELIQKGATRHDTCRAGKTGKVDLFASSRLRWLPVEDAWCLGAGKEVVIMAPAGIDTWRLASYESGKIQVLHEQLPSDWAMGIGEDRAKAFQKLAGRNARWLALPPSERQLGRLVREGFPAEKLDRVRTRGDAADLITRIQGRRAVKKMGYATRA